MGNFCAKGREIENSHTNHIFTKEELRVLEREESQDYLPSNSNVYRKWLRQYKSQNVDNGLDKWFLMGAVGVTVGFLGFLVKSATGFIVTNKYAFIAPYVEEADLTIIWAWLAGIGLLLALLSSVLVVCVAPEAAGSGIPEVIGYLNGVRLHEIWRLRIFVIKFWSVIFAVASGLPCGPEGPMIHMGALVGKGLSQGTFEGKDRSYATGCFHRFRTTKHMRDFISAGAAAGIASAFGAPVGGLLFSMEEVSSFWNQTLSWQIFFCSMCATFTTDLFVSAFGGFTWKGTFGAFNEEDGIIFQVDKALSINIAVFIPAVLLGLLGGVLGALFTFLNLKITRCRNQHIKPHKALRVGEPMLIVLITTTLTVFLPMAFPCVRTECPGVGQVNATLAAEASSGNICQSNPRHPLQAPEESEEYFCHSADFLATHIGVDDVAGVDEGNVTYYNPMANLLFVEGEETIENLLARNTYHTYDYPELLTLLLVYFPLASWCAGSAISSGIVVPMLLLGSCIGRILGLGMVDMFGVFPEGYWSWIDEGAMALIGASAFFGGVSRLTMSLTVIMVEITNDIRFLLPIMTSVIIAKLVADGITHSLYHALLEVKCIPFLPDTPRFSESLELHNVSKIMTRDVICVNLKTTAGELAQILASCRHHAFPVVAKANREVNGHVVHAGEFVGMIMRPHVERILAAVLAYQATHLKQEDKHSPVRLRSLNMLQGTIGGSGKTAPKRGAARRQRRRKKIVRKEAALGHGAGDTSSDLEQNADEGPTGLLLYTDLEQFGTTSVRKLGGHTMETFLNTIIASPADSAVPLSLADFVNTSSFTVTEDFSVERAFLLFRTMGLRHLAVLSMQHTVAGILTRKEMMGYHIERSLHVHADDHGDHDDHDEHVRTENSKDTASLHPVARSVGHETEAASLNAYRVSSSGLARTDSLGLDGESFASQAKTKGRRSSRVL